MKEQIICDFMGHGFMFTRGNSNLRVKKKKKPIVGGLVIRRLVAHRRVGDPIPRLWLHVKVSFISLLIPISLQIAAPFV